MTSKSKRATDKDTEVLDRLDMVNKSLATIRQDIAAIVRDTVSQVLKERKKYVEVGYR
jgi:hypothetical protein